MVPKGATLQCHTCVLHNIRLTTLASFAIFNLRSKMHKMKRLAKYLFAFYSFPLFWRNGCPYSKISFVWLRLNRKQILGNKNKIDKKQPMESVFSNFGNQPLWNSHSLLSPPYSQTCPELVQGCYVKYKVRQRTPMCRDNWTIKFLDWKTQGA